MPDSITRPGRPSLDAQAVERATDCPQCRAAKAAPCLTNHEPPHRRPPHRIRTTIAQLLAHQDD